MFIIIVFDRVLKHSSPVSLQDFYCSLQRDQSRDVTSRLAPLEFVFQKQSYSSLHSGRSLAWDHVRGDIADPCGVFAIPEAIGGRRPLRDSLNIIKHC